MSGSGMMSHMHPIQEKLLALSKKQNLAKLSLREMAAGIGLPKESPQKIKHHLLQLQKRGFVSIDRSKGMMSQASTRPGWSSGLLEKASRALFHSYHRHGKLRPRHCVR
jgi:hypothetical protein